jgi:hypothetical protein
MDELKIEWIEFLNNPANMNFVRSMEMFWVYLFATMGV